MLILKKDDIKKCFTMRDAIEADKEALEIYSEGKAKVRLRDNIDIDEKNGQNLYMPACVGGSQAAAQAGQAHGGGGCAHGADRRRPGRHQRRRGGV